MGILFVITCYDGPQIVPIKVVPGAGVPVFHCLFPFVVLMNDCSY